jgi:hypothetical protein
MTAAGPGLGLHRKFCARVACWIALAGLPSVVGFAPPVRAEDCREIPKLSCREPMHLESARGLALGTGSRASALSSSALAYSPAALAIGGLYHIEGNVDYLAGHDTVALGGIVTDSSTSKVGAGIGFRGFLASSDDGYDGLDGRLGLALPLSPQFALGVSGRYIDLSTHREPSQTLAEGFTMDASMRITPANGLQIDFAALNFIDLDSALVPLMLNAGFAFAVASVVSVGVDLLTDMSTFEHPEFSLGGGIEYLGIPSVPLRAGYAVDFARRIHVLSAGIGYTDQVFGVDIGLRQQVHPGYDTRIMGAVRYYLH